MGTKAGAFSRAVDHIISQTPEVNFQVHWQKNQASVSLPNRLSVLEAVSFKTTCHQLIGSEPAPEKILLDFGQTTRAFLIAPVYMRLNRKARVCIVLPRPISLKIMQ